MMLNYFPLAIDSGGGGGGGGDTYITTDEGDIIMGQPVTRINARGLNADVDSGTEDVQSNGGTLNIPSAAAATTIVSSNANDTAAGTGARTVKIKGIDDNYSKLEETASLNGATPVALVGSYFRINSIEVLTAGSGGSNAGIIDVKHSTTVLLSVPVGYNRSQAAFFSPYGQLKSWLITKVYCDILSDHTTDDVSFQLVTRKQDGVWQVRWIGLAKETLSAPINLDPGEDVKLQAVSTVANMSVIGGFDVVGSSTPL